MVKFNESNVYSMSKIFMHFLNFSSLSYLDRQNPMFLDREIGL